MKAKLIIPEKLRQNWVIDKHNILNTKTVYGNTIFKFSYHVKSGQFIFAEEPMHHNIMIKI